MKPTSYGASPSEHIDKLLYVLYILMYEHAIKAEVKQQ